MERFDVSPIKINHLAFKLSKSGARRLRIWLRRKAGKGGTGYRQYPDQYLYEKLGLVRLREFRTDLSNAKV